MAITLSKGKSLSVFSLVMINVIAVDSLRTLPISAEYGAALLLFYLLAGVLFFIPVALVSAELATGWPETGGLYVWIREAFGKKWAFLIICWQWIYNVVWYPTIMAFIASAIAYLFDPELANSKFYIICSVLVLFWLATLVNMFGMKISSIMSIVAALVGTLLPIMMIIALGAWWLFGGHPLAIQLNLGAMIPHKVDLSSMVLLTGILFGLVGMEMSAVHAGDVKHPQKDFPKALAISTVLILGTLMLGSLAVAMVVPMNQLSLVTGVYDAFAIFFKALNAPWLLPLVISMMILGALGSVSAWVIGPSRGLMIAANDGCLPDVLCYQNRHGAPVAILVLQATIFTFLSMAFICFDDINVSYWMLSALTEQLAMMVYIGMFLAAFWLRWTKPDVNRAFTVPGGIWGMGLVVGVASMVCLAAVLIGFVPPKQLNVTSISFYEGFLVVGLLVFSIIPILTANYQINHRTKL